MVDEGRHSVPASSPSGDPSSDQEKNIPEREERTGSPIGRRTVSLFKTLIFTLLVAFFLKIFVVEAFRIPSGSMENTLLVGDFLIVNKLAYGLKTPRFVPLTNLPIPSVTVPLFTSVGRGDVVVFEFPGKHSGEDSAGPEYYIKRCMGIPGDTIMMRQGLVTINGREVLLPSHAKSSVFSGRVVVDNFDRGTPAGLTNDGNNFGPTIVPKKGDVVPLTPLSIPSWKKLIEREQHNLQISSSGAILIDGVATTQYVVEHNYYFMLGDNRGNSLDSRFWGFVPDDHVIGEALLLYWSQDPDRSDEGVQARSATVRWNRIGTFIR
jgi:signal peptidase I